MLINKYKFLISIAIVSLFFSSCSTVKEAFDPQRKNSSEEFLVEKKSPLSMPPNFEELPIPQNNNDESEEESESEASEDEEEISLEVFTCEQSGEYEGVDLLIENGIISNIDFNINNPKNYKEIDLTNLHVSRGWFDSSRHIPPKSFLIYITSI